MSNKKWTITHIHSTLVFYVETKIGRKPWNDFSYMSWRITFIGSTNFLFFPATTGRRLQAPSFSCYNLREDPTPQFSGYNQKGLQPPMFSGYKQKVATTTYPFPILSPWSISKIMKLLSHCHIEIYHWKPVPINLSHASTMHQPVPQLVINLYHIQVHQPCTNLYQITCNQPIP